MPSFFALPLLFAALLAFCFGAVLATSSAGGALFVLVPAALLVLCWLALFLSSASPAARLIYVQEGRIEEALSISPLRLALGAQFRRLFWRARLASLPAYLPALAGLLLVAALSTQPFPGRLLLLPLLCWLTMSALLYAHLVVVQLYVAAEQEGQRIGTR